MICERKRIKRDSSRYESKSLFWVFGGTVGDIQPRMIFTFNYERHLQTQIDTQAAIATCQDSLLVTLLTPIVWAPQPSLYFYIV